MKKFYLCLMFLALFSCQEWGQMDPPAGTDKAPIMAQVAQFTFEDETELPALAGAAAVVDDEELAGKVLHLPVGSSAVITNPLGDAQDGVAFTFFVKQALVVTEEDGLVVDKPAGTLLSVTNENASQRLVLTNNGTLVYEGVDGKYTAGADVTTGMLSPTGEWHYVAVMVKRDGYAVYVDGKQRIDRTVTRSTFDFQKIVNFMGATSNIIIGAGGDGERDEMWIDDFTIFRNQITSRQWNDPRTPSAGDDEGIERYVTVGSTGFSDGFWGTHSELFTMTGDNTLHMEFTNYTDGIDLWNNYVLVLTNGKAYGEDGYTEYLVLRGDSGFWGSMATTVTKDFDQEADIFKTRMNGAWVEIDLTRSGNTVTISAVMTATDGTVMNMTSVTTGDMVETLGVFFTGEESYIVIDRLNWSTGRKYAPGSYVGATDNSSGYFGASSDVWTMTGDGVMDIRFVNYGAGGGNWNNWNIAADPGPATPAWDGPHYFVWRADNWENMAASNANCTIDLAGDDWTVWLVNMNGAIVNMRVIRQGETITINATSTATNGSGRVYTHGFTYTNADLPVSIDYFLNTDGSHYEMQRVGVPYWYPIKEE